MEHVEFTAELMTASTRVDWENPSYGFGPRLRFEAEIGSFTGDIRDLVAAYEALNRIGPVDRVRVTVRIERVPRYGEGGVRAEPVLFVAGVLFAGVAVVLFALRIALDVPSLVPSIVIWGVGLAVWLAWSRWRRRPFPKNGGRRE